MSTTVQPTNVHPFPVVKPGFRLAPARIGRKGRMQTVYLQCPTWCTENHVENWNNDLEDVNHYGDMGGVAVPTMERDFAQFEWYARIASDPIAAEPSLRAAHVLIGDGGADEARLTPDMADEVADEIISFASEIRSAARTARLHNAAGDSDQNLDEALRRVQGGVAS